ncbi:hypothetical protein D3OALGB2SA_2504 [Olavius algarvensis associated proteobacterium Delta 3]|nr:hypothetical protein D3OALGB2SA_2504 [Olavius algarvensis associated proteobacterium Delta 3]
MAMQDAQACMKKMFTDESFAVEVTKVASQDAFFSLSKENGFDFTLEEWQRLTVGVDAQARAWAKENNIEIRDQTEKTLNIDELTDQELEAVAGGAWVQWTLGGLFGTVGSIAGAIAGGIPGGIAGVKAGGAVGALFAGVGAVPGAIIGGVVGAGAGGVAGGIGGASGGANFGNLVGGWIEDAVGIT